DVMAAGPLGIEHTFDQVGNAVGTRASQARPITPGGKTSNRLCAHDPLRCSLRASCLTAYRRWLDRAGTFTNMTLPVLGGPCCDWHAAAYFYVEKPYLAGPELRPNAGRRCQNWPTASQ